MNDFFEELKKAIEDLKTISVQENWSSDEYHSVLNKIRAAEEAVIRSKAASEMISERADDGVQEEEKEPQSPVISIQPESIASEQEENNETPENDSVKEISNEEESEDSKEEIEPEEQSVPTEDKENREEEKPRPEVERSDEELKERIEKDAQSMAVEDGIELNERNKGQDNSLASRLQQSRITDLKAAIGLNERFLFANELFDGNMEAFNRALNELNHIDSKEGAYVFINAQLKERFDWNDDSEITIRFLNLVERRFL